MHCIYLLMPTGAFFIFSSFHALPYSSFLRDISSIFPSFHALPSSAFPAGLVLHFLIFPRIFFILISCKTFPPSAHAACHQFVYLLILLLILLVLSYIFSSCHQFCWFCQTSSPSAINPLVLPNIFSSCHNSAGAVISSHPAISSSYTSLHLTILPSILLILPEIFSSCYRFFYDCHKYSHPAIISSCTAIHLLTLPSILQVLSNIFSSCHQFFRYCHTSSHPVINSSCDCHTNSHPAINSSGAPKNLLILPSIFLYYHKSSHLPSVLLVLPYIFSSCHQFVLYFHTSLHPAVNSSSTPIHLLILPSFLVTAIHRLLMA